jgi:hypothetical protein
MPADSGTLNDTNLQWAKTKIKMLLCPSDLETTNANVVMAFHFFNVDAPPPIRGSPRTYNRGSLTQYWPLGLTNYAGVGGAGKGISMRFQRWEGIYTNRGQITLSNIQDGTSNTMLYGESCGRVMRMTPTARADLCWFGVGSLPTTTGLGQGQNAFNDQFSSNHPGIVQFCFADGSVRSVRIGGTGNGPPDFSPDWMILQALAGYHDGEVVNSSDLVN